MPLKRIYNLDIESSHKYIIGSALDLKLVIAKVQL